MENTRENGSKRTQRSHPNITKKRGAPYGNKNAVGHGAPKGNQNAKGFGAPYGNSNGVIGGKCRKSVVLIPYTPENLLVFAAMKQDGVDLNKHPIYPLFNEYKKKMKPQIRAMQEQIEKVKQGKKN